MAAEPMTKSRASASLGGALRAESSEGVLRVIFSGEWKRDLLGPNFFTERDEALRETERLLKEARSVELLGEALGEWDSGVLVVTTRLVTLAKEHNIPLDDARLPEGIRNLTKLALAVPPNTAAQRKAQKTTFLERVGGFTLAVPRMARDIFDFIGELVLSAGRLFRGRSSCTSGNVWLAVQESGVDALPIVSLISLLVGLILAFVGVIQLKMFGAEIYVSSLVAVSMTRIMGAIMTGIILAGRTGASYAAVIGTMQVNEEIDALTTLGVAPSDYLIMPRVLALTAMTPLLVLYSDFMGIMGGFIVGVGILGLDQHQQPLGGHGARRGLRYAHRHNRLLPGPALRPQRRSSRQGDHLGRGLFHRGHRAVHGCPHHPLQYFEYMNTSTPIIEARDLTVGYGSYVVQKDLNFTINRQDVFIIMGPSGCGKSTLLRVLVGLLQPTKGQVLYRGQDFWAGTESERQKLLSGVGLLFQSGALWSSMTLAENVALPLQRYTKLSSAEIREQTSLKLALVGLAGFEDYYPSEISGGMRKRAGLARALAMDPEIVFFDEPSAGLDPVSAALLDELILELKENMGMTVVVVTHDLDSIFTIGNNSVFLDAATHTMITGGDPHVLRCDQAHPDIVRFLNRGKTDSCPTSSKGYRS